MKTTYVARCERDETDVWCGVVEVEPYRSAIGDGPTLERMKARLRKSLALLLECDENAFDLELDVALPEEAKSRLAEAKAAAQMAAVAQASATSAAQMSAVYLSRANLSLRDVGELMGVTRQRASQLLAAAAKRKTQQAPRGKRPRRSDRATEKESA